MCADFMRVMKFVFLSQYQYQMQFSNFEFVDKFLKHLCMLVGFGLNLLPENVPIQKLNKHFWSKNAAGSCLCQTCGKILLCMSTLHQTHNRSP